MNEDVKTKKIQNTSPETLERIKKKSALVTGTNPSEKNLSPQKIRESFVAPITDRKDSMLAELNRVIDEINGVIGLIEEGDIENNESVWKAIEELRFKIENIKNSTIVMSRTQPTNGAEFWLEIMDE